jgi:hypothetical protein
MNNKRPMAYLDVSGSPNRAERQVQNPAHWHLNGCHA